jgi:hypothetical protein
MLIVENPWTSNKALVKDRKTDSQLGFAYVYFVGTGGRKGRIAKRNPQADNFQEA